MNSATHPVSPEEVMEYLDGESSAAGAEAIRRHIDTCAECAGLANQFQVTSQTLAKWSVPAVPEELEGFVRSAAVESAAGKKLRKPKSIFMRAAFWSGKQWTFGGAAAFAGVLVLLVAFALRPRDQYKMHAYLSEPSFLKQETLANLSPDNGAESRRNSQNEAATWRPANEAKSQAGDMLFDSPTPRAGIARGGGAGVVAPAPPPSPTAPMIARTASLSITVKDFSASRAALDATLARHHGYAAELTLSTPENSARSFLTSLRLPQAELTAAIADLRTLGRVEFEKQTGEEVTQQHADLVARLKNSREEESRLQAILQQRTGKIEDVLQVEEEIARVRGEIESMEAEQKALEHRVDFASVDLELKEEYKARLDAPSYSAATRLHNAAVDGLHYAWDVSLGIVLWFVEYGPALLVYLVIFGIPAYFLWRRYRKMHARL